MPHFNWLDALLVKGKQGIWIESQLPKGIVHVIAPPSIGVPVAGARGGHLIVPGSSQLDHPFAIPAVRFCLNVGRFPRLGKRRRDIHCFADDATLSRRSYSA